MNEVMVCYEPNGSLLPHGITSLSLQFTPLISVARSFSLTVRFPNIAFIRLISINLIRHQFNQAHVYYNSTLYTLPIAYALKYVNAISITFRIIISSNKPIHLSLI